MSSKNWYTVFIPTMGHTAVSVRADGEADALEIAQERVFNDEVDFSENEPLDSITWTVSKEVMS